VVAYAMVPICLDAVSTARLFVKLILRKIIKIAATRCNISKLKCNEFHFCPRPHWGSGRGGAEKRKGSVASWLLGMDAPGRVHLHFSVDAFK